MFKVYRKLRFRQFVFVKTGANYRFSINYEKSKDFLLAVFFYVVFRKGEYYVQKY